MNTMGDIKMDQWVTQNCTLQNNWLTLNCQEGEYNPMATLFIPGYNGFFTNIFHNTSAFGVDNLVIFLVVVFSLVLLLN